MMKEKLSDSTSFYNAVLRKMSSSKKLSQTRRRKFPSCVLKAAKRLGISRKKAQESYNRGVGAWRTNPKSVRNTKGVKGGRGRKMSSARWACARVNKLRRGGKYDQDLLQKSRKKKTRRQK